MANKLTIKFTFQQRDNSIGAKKATTWPEFSWEKVPWSPKQTEPLSERHGEVRDRPKREFIPNPIFTVSLSPGSEFILNAAIQRVYWESIGRSSNKLIE